ncbi:MAG: hypothetical protein WA885_02245 [Phormidesmis sp.]
MNVFMNVSIKSMRRRLLWAFLTIIACVIYTASPLRASDPPALISQSVPAQGIRLEQTETPEVYFSYHGAPLLSFGGMSDFIFYTDQDAFDYKRWADWQAEHGMNHVRAYPPFSWQYIEYFSRDNGGAKENLLLPYEETQPGSRQFDLTRFNQAYWNRFHQQCEYLQQKGIIIHLLMINGWQMRDDEDSWNWPGHFFNPENNINEFTDHLADNRLDFYKSVADQKTQLAAAQRAWFEKVVETTADLDNVYYDLVHEIAENYDDWPKTQVWIEEMAQAVRSRYAQQQTEEQANESSRPIILGMDTGGLEDKQRDWIFSRPYFDILVYGKVHEIDRAMKWRSRYKKPYIPQETWDEDGTKYTYREPSHRVHLRKYFWKMMMARFQQMDLYIKPFDNVERPEFRHNYNPNGWNPFEDDALVLRQTWNQLTDYPNLWFQGEVQSGPGDRQNLLSSEQEGLVYLSSNPSKENVDYDAQSLQLKSLALQDGTYMADIISPEEGTLTTTNVTVERGRTALDLPAFTDDIAVHIFKDGDAVAQSLESSDSDATEEGEQNARTSDGWFYSLLALLLTGLLGIFLVRRVVAR